MKFYDKNHEKFWNEKYKILMQYGKTDVYYRSLVYVLGMCPVTRDNFSKIFSIEKGEINLDAPSLAFQTSTSAKVTRMAFSLWNSNNCYECEQDYNDNKPSTEFNPSSIFCCDYAPYLYEGVKIRYPEYTREQQYEYER